VHTNMMFLLALFLPDMTKDNDQKEAEFAWTD
jgi:hypothetical protein